MSYFNPAEFVKTLVNLKNDFDIEVEIVEKVAEEKKSIE
jgi:hypothetical protein